MNLIEIYRRTVVILTDGSSTVQCFHTLLILVDDMEIMHDNVTSSSTHINTWETAEIMRIVYKFL